MKRGLFSLILLSWLSCSVAEEFDDWGDDWEEESPFQLSHELSYGYAYLIDDHSVNLNNSVLNELRSRSKFDYQADNYSFHFELELYADALTDELRINPYELNLFIPFTSNIDIRIGRQVITWGTGDLLFLNDLFAKDWKSFFNGREDRFLKPPVDAIRTSYYGESVNVEIALMPSFESDQSLTGERYSFFLPGTGITQPQPELPIQQEDEAEISARIFANYEGVEWAVYAYSGYFKSPSLINTAGLLGFSKMQALGASLRFPLGAGLVNTEFVYYQSKDDKSGVNPFVENSQSRYLVGYEQEIASEVTLGLQGYLEKTKNHQALLNHFVPGQLVPKENRTMITMRLTHQAIQQTLLNSLMLFYSLTDDDHYVRYSSQYTIDDHWKVIAGANLLGGQREETFLAQMQENNNLFFRVQYSFGA